MRKVRDPGDAWVEAADGNKYWGRFGAAGLIAYDRERDAILLQHRVSWSDHGGTWGIPGGARHQHEGALAGAIREAQEEAGVPDGAVKPRLTHVLDRTGWTYTTVIADVVTPFQPRITDPESVALEWVPVSEVTERELHPAFAGSFQLLRPLLTAQFTVIVDAANVIGSIPDGWWKDRLGAAERLRNRLDALAGEGVPASLVGADTVQGVDTVFPDWHLVTEGATAGLGSSSRVRVTSAPKSGDDVVVNLVGQLAERERSIAVVTSDRELRERCRAAGATRVLGARTLTERLP